MGIPQRWCKATYQGLCDTTAPVVGVVHSAKREQDTTRLITTKVVYIRSSDKVVAGMRKILTAGQV